MTPGKQLTPEQQAEEDELMACCVVVAHKYSDHDVKRFDAYLKESLILLDETRKEFAATNPPFPFMPYAKQLIRSHIKLTAEEIARHERSIPPLTEHKLRDEEANDLPI